MGALLDHQILSIAEHVSLNIFVLRSLGMLFAEFMAWFREHRQP